ncbi:MAG: ATP-binding protein [Fimbriimonadaceae bacterium]|nr:ATP-binding protein [Fimbriimonadaceae bacterium]
MGSNTFGWKAAAVGAPLLLVAAALLSWSGSVAIRAEWMLLGGAAVLALATSLIFREWRQVELDRREDAWRLELLELESTRQREAVDALADGLEVAILICGAKTQILYANRRARELFGFDDPRGRPIVAVTLSYELEKLVLGAEETGEPQSAELTFSYPEARVARVKAWLAPDGRALVTIIDLTALRHLERVRQDFVANVSHELRTPLSVIRAMAETLLEDPEADEALHETYLAKIVGEVDRLSLIANDLLILGAAESNPVRKQACDVADVFRTSLGQLERKAREKGLEVAYKGPDHCVIPANATQISQVATNLIDNAINYTSQGSVTVALQRREKDVLITVADTGIGIASEHLPRLWERFYRIDKARSRSTGGTGLGLSIVKHIVEVHGGTVSVRSALNEGSTFEVTLPVGDEEATPEV